MRNSRAASFWERLAYYVRVPMVWARLTAHNTWGILNVLDLIWLRPMRGGLIDAHHPFATGRDPESGERIWSANLIFRTVPREDWTGKRPPDADEEIVRRVGEHLCRQVGLVVERPGLPTGGRSPMPPAIHYIHGGVHFNGGWLLFNDFKEAIEHFSDRRFVVEFRRFVREERREPVTLFRDRDYDRDEFARFVCFLRTVLPWFSNSNGPKKHVLWGNPSPYPAVNTITGNWIRDCRALKTPRGRARAPRPPILPGRYFQSGPYRGVRRETRWPENLLAWATEWRIRIRGARENLYFVDKRKLRSGFRYGPEPIPSPWRRIKQWWARASRRVFGGVLLGGALFGSDAMAWGPHPEITRAAVDALDPNDPLKVRFGARLLMLTNYCWMADYRRLPYDRGGEAFYADDYLLFPEAKVHWDHICPEVKETYRPYFQRALQALRTESDINALRWTGSLLHFVEDSGSPPHAAQIRGQTHIRMENWVDAAEILVPGYQPRLLGTNDAQALDGFLRRMDELILFAKPRGERSVLAAQIGLRGRVEPVTLECALETSRATADVLHTLGYLMAKGPRHGTELRGKLAMEGSLLARVFPAKILCEGTLFSTLSDADGSFVLRELPPGAYTVRALVPGQGRALLAGVELAPGQPRECHFQFDEAPLNLLRNGDFGLCWVRSEAPDNWIKTPLGWEGEVVPLRAGTDYRVSVQFQEGASDEVVLRWSRQLPEKIPRMGGRIPAIDSNVITPSHPFLDFEGSDTIALIQVTVRSQASSPLAVCREIILAPKQSVPE